MYEEIEFFMSVCSGGKCTEVIFEMLGNLNVSKFLLKRHTWLTLQTAKFMSHHFTKFPRLFFHIFLQQINIWKNFILSSYFFSHFKFFFDRKSEYTWKNTIRGKISLIKSFIFSSWCGAKSEREKNRGKENHPKALFLFVFIWFICKLILLLCDKFVFLLFYLSYMLWKFSGSNLMWYYMRLMPILCGVFFWESK